MECAPPEHQRNGLQDFENACRAHAATNTHGDHHPFGTTAFAFNEAVTPHAMQFGIEPIRMGSIATLGGALGRTMSPITGACIICATIAQVNPMELAKRNAPGMIVAIIVSMFILL